MSKVVIVNYTIQDAFKIPASIDLEDKSVVKFWGVKWNKLCIYFVDGTEKEIESVGWIDEFDYKHPTGEPEIDYANNYGLEDDEDEEEKEGRSVCPVCDFSYTEGMIEREEVVPCCRCYKCFHGDCGMTACECVFSDDEEGSTTNESEEEDPNTKPCVGCGNEKINITECGGEKGINMCNKCFGIPSDDEEEEAI